jgi:hypothetical protein
MHTEMNSDMETLTKVFTNQIADDNFLWVRGMWENGIMQRY